MSLFSEISDPTNLVRIREILAKGPQPERLVSLGLSDLVIADDAYLQVVELTTKVCNTKGVHTDSAKVLLLVDATKILRDGEDFKEIVQNMLEGSFIVHKLVLGGDHLLVDDAALEAASNALAEMDAVVSVGSGTISDIAKVASFRNGNKPLVVVQTAASVDGFTDNVSVVLKDGAKRTVPSTWPDAVIADTVVIQNAPLELNSAGFGEALSLFTAPADWWLAHRLRFDDSFHLSPRDLLLTFAGDPSSWGAGLNQGKKESVEQLTKVLAIRGIGTGIAGTTACLSGVEHLVSHMLDMKAVADNQNVGLHGAQVGVASLLAAEAWHYLIEKSGSFERFEQKTEKSLQTAISEAFDSVDPTGKLAGECWNDYSKKLAKWESQKTLASALLVSWRNNPAELKSIAPSSELLARSLMVSGAPSEISHLEPWINDEIWNWAVANCHLMRNRFTVVDLLFFMGFWNTEDHKILINRAKQRVGVAI